MFFSKQSIKTKKVTPDHARTSIDLLGKGNKIAKISVERGSFRMAAKGRGILRDKRRTLSTTGAEKAMK